MAPSNLTAKAACQQTVARAEGPADLLAETMQTALPFRKAALAASPYRLGPALTASTVDTDFTACHPDTFAAPRSCRHCPSAERLGIPNISDADIPAGLDAGRWALAW